jgi:hypothetical protein
MVDPNLARFTLPEKSGNNVHYMLFYKRADGVVAMHYKLKRYCDALWPRAFNETDEFLAASGKGEVIKCLPFKDAMTKTKYWHYTVQFKNESGSTFEEVQLTPRGGKLDRD